MLLGKRLVCTNNVTTPWFGLKGWDLFSTKMSPLRGLGSPLFWGIESFE